jgi:hypothetical protein
VHLPRFSQYYKAAFNEHPSQTLQRAKLGMSLFGRS